YIINEALAGKIGWTPQDAIGRTIEKGSRGPIMGVVKNFNFSSFHEPIGPLLIFLGRDFSRDFMVRVNGNDMQCAVSCLVMVWKLRVPYRSFHYHVLDE